MGRSTDDNRGRRAKPLTRTGRGEGSGNRGDDRSPVQRLVKSQEEERRGPCLKSRSKKKNDEMGIQELAQKNEARREVERRGRETL